MQSRRPKITYAYGDYLHCFAMIRPPATRKNRPHTGGFLVYPLGFVLAQTCPLRSGTLAPTYRRSLFSSLQGIINALLNG